MNDRKVSKAEWTEVCGALRSAPRQKFNIGALMRSAADYAIVGSILSVRFTNQSNRERLATELQDLHCKSLVQQVVQRHFNLSLDIQSDLIQIRDYYVDIIKQIMEEHELQTRRSTHKVLAQATAEEVLWYTNWYVAGDDQISWRRPDRHYRFSRYMTVLNRLQHHLVTPGLTQVDIGCGPGLFSWVLLDWARQHGLGYSGLSLYGYDHSPEMIALAQEVQSRLRVYVRDTPKVEYHYDSSSLFSRLEESAEIESHYLVSFGYVLAGSHEDYAIKSYVEIINHILSLTHTDCKCILAVSDASYQGDFRVGWNKLVSELERNQIMFTDAVASTDVPSDRYVLLSRQEV